MECLPVNVLPESPDWVYELKLDGLFDRFWFKYPHSRRHIFAGKWGCFRSSPLVNLV
jgi:hypothetical protein